MGRMCAMIGCPNSVHKIDKWYTQLCEKHGLKFRSCTCHPPFQLIPFPSEDKDPDGRSRWIRLVKRKTASGSKWQPKAHDRICSEHFKDGEPTKEWPDPTEKLGYQLAPFQSSSQSPRNPPRERTAHIPKKRARFRGKLEDTESTPETFPHENSEEGPLPTDFSPSIEDLRPEEPKRYKPYSRLDLNNCSKHATFCRHCSERQSVIDELKKENRELKKIINLSKGDSETFATSIVTQKDKSELCYRPDPCYPPASFTMESPATSTTREINEEMLDEEPQTSEREVYPLAPFTMESQATSPMREIMEEELDEEPQTSEREGYPQAPFTMESQAISPMREIKEEELDEEPQTSEREVYPSAPFTMESQATSPMREIKEEELDEEPQTSEREGYQIVYIKQELNDEDTWQDDGAQMQIHVHVPVKTESSSESDGNPTFQECNQDSGSQLSKEDGEQDDRGGLNEEGWSTASSVIEKQSRTQIIVREKKVCLAKKLQFVEDSSHRSRVKYNRIKGIFRKAHQLAELTKSEVFLFLRDELSKTTYWGTSDALQLFQPTLDTSIVKGGKRVRSVKFVTPSKPSENPRGAIPSNLEAPDSDPDLHSCSTNESTSQIPPTASQSMYELIAQEQESIFSRGSPSQTTTRIPQVNAKEKKVFVAKKLQVVEDSRRRCVRQGGIESRVSSGRLTN